MADKTRMTEADSRPAMNLPWVVAHNFSGAPDCCIICFSDQPMPYSFVVMAKDLAPSVAAHIVKLHNASLP
jgi:hypothetical protein